MATVHTPVKGFTGKVAGVAFTDGKGETTDKNALAYFRRHGYGIGKPPKGRTDPAPAPDGPKTESTSDLRDAADEVFDPSGHSVEEVNDHLEQADDGERARVLAAEADGKDRKGIVDGPHAG